MPSAALGRPHGHGRPHGLTLCFHRICLIGIVGLILQLSEHTALGQPPVSSSVAAANKIFSGIATIWSAATIPATPAVPVLVSDHDQGVLVGSQGHVSYKTAG